MQMMAPVRRVVIDTSSIIFGFSKKIDVFEKIREEFPGHEILMPSGVIGELEKIGKEKMKESVNARYALGVIGKLGLKVVPSYAYVDRWLLEKAEGIGCIVCTNDGELRKKLSAKGLKVVSVSVGGAIR
jgi:rRNA-processing protein FCF1